MEIRSSRTLLYESNPLFAALDLRLAFFRAVWPQRVGLQMLTINDSHQRLRSVFHTSPTHLAARRLQSALQVPRLSDRQVKTLGYQSGFLAWISEVSGQCRQRIVERKG